MRLRVAYEFERNSQGCGTALQGFKQAGTMAEFGAMERTK
jgi:hypothetical protein